MNRLKLILARTWNAARANFLPGLLLQCLLVVFLAAYASHEGTRQVMAQIASFKEESGYLFAFVFYILSAAVLPEVLVIAFFQQGRTYRFNIRNILTAAPGWGLIGIMVDFLYRCQIVWFGAGSDWGTVAAKVLVDQLVYSPFVGTPLTLAYFHWRDAGFRLAGFRKVFSWNFPGEILTVQGAGWCVWFPGTFFVYSLPSGVQIPAAVLIQAFWVLIFTMVKRPYDSAPLSR